jgi:hypothetical protein
MLHVNGVPICTDCDKKFNDPPPATLPKDSGSGKGSQPPVKAYSQAVGAEWHRAPSR